MSEIFFGGTDETGLLVGIKSQPEEDTQSSGLERIFEQIIAFIEVESHKDSLRSKMVYSGADALFHFNIIVSVLQQWRSVI